MSRIKLFSLLSLGLLLILSFSSNPPQGRTGGPGETTCAASGCHTGVAVAIAGHLTLRGLPDHIQKGTNYNLSIDLVVDRGDPVRGGFQMIALSEDGQDTNGFVNPGENSTISMSNDRTYFEHDPAKRFEGGDTLTYNVDWSLPDDINADQVIFYISGILANGNGGRLGDRIVTLKDTFDLSKPIGELDTIPPQILCIVDTININSCTPLSYPTPTATDEGGEVTMSLISGVGPNQSFDAGLHLEIYEASDDVGNMAQCTIFINNTVTIEPNITIMDIPCYEDSLGAIELVSSGDNPPFAAVVDGANMSLDALPEGMHSILITDATGCQVNEEIIIQRPDSLSLGIVNIQRPIDTDSGDGAIDIKVSGGTPPYTYQWRTEDEDFAREEDLSLLFPGVYIVMVTDSRACTAMSDSIILETVTFTVDPNLSNQISIFPNPARARVNIQISDHVEPQYVEIVDLMGRKIRAMQWVTNDYDISDLQSGIYLMIVTMKNKKKGVVIFSKV